MLHQEFGTDCLGHVLYTVAQTKYLTTEKLAHLNMENTKYEAKNSKNLVKMTMLGAEKAYLLAKFVPKISFFFSLQTMPRVVQVVLQNILKLIQNFCILKVSNNLVQALDCW